MNHTEPAYFYDPQLEKLIRNAERARKWYWRLLMRVNWWGVLGLACLACSAWFVIWGVALAIDKGF